MLTGIDEQDVCIQEGIVRVLKEAEDAVIVETDSSMWLLDPPGPLD